MHTYNTIVDLTFRNFTKICCVESSIVEDIVEKSIFLLL